VGWADETDIKDLTEEGKNIFMKREDRNSLFDYTVMWINE
jgi:hypothetical protein